MGIAVAYMGKYVLWWAEQSEARHQRSLVVVNSFPKQKVVSLTRITSKGLEANRSEREHMLHYISFSIPSESFFLFLFLFLLFLSLFLLRLFFLFPPWFPDPALHREEENKVILGEKTVFSFKTPIFVHRKVSCCFRCCSLTRKGPFQWPAAGNIVNSVVLILN